MGAPAPAPTSSSIAPVPATPATPERVASQFLTLGRQDGVSRLSIELGYVAVDGDEEAFDVTPLRVGLYGQIVDPSGMGGYGSVNIAHLSGEGDSATALGNLELGGVYAGTLGTIEGVGRLGIALPTAADDDFADVLANVLSSYSRIDDIVHALPDVTWIRASGSPIIRRQGMTLRADLGVDLPVAAEDNLDPDPILHANLGGGLVAGPHQVSLELVNLFIMGDDEAERLHSVGASYRAELDKVAPYFGVFKPFGSDGDFDELTFSLIGGVSGDL